MASKSKKRRRVFRASCILAALIIAGSSFAWFTSKDEVTNRLSASGDYDVSIVESFAPPAKWVPGQAVNKDVYAVNTGSVDAFVKESVSSVLTVVTEEAYDGTANKPDAESIELTPAERYVVEAGAFLAYAPLGSKYTDEDGKVISGMKAIAMNPDFKNENGYTAANATDFTPDVEGLYVFRRTIGVDHTTQLENYTYDAYYYVPGTGSSIKEQQKTANNVTIYKKKDSNTAVGAPDTIALSDPSQLASLPGNADGYEEKTEAPTTMDNVPVYKIGNDEFATDKPELFAGCTPVYGTPVQATGKADGAGENDPEYPKWVNKEDSTDFKYQATQPDGYDPVYVEVAGVDGVFYKVSNLAVTPEKATFAGDLDQRDGMVKDPTYGFYKDVTKTVVPTLTYDKLNNRLVASYNTGVTKDNDELRTLAKAYEDAAIAYQDALEEYAAALGDQDDTRSNLNTDKDLADATKELREKVDDLLAAQYAREAAEQKYEAAKALAAQKKIAMENAKDAMDEAAGNLGTEYLVDDNGGYVDENGDPVDNDHKVLAVYTPATNTETAKNDTLWGRYNAAKLALGEKTDEYNPDTGNYNTAYGRENYYEDIRDGKKGNYDDAVNERKAATQDEREAFLDLVVAKSGQTIGAGDDAFTVDDFNAATQAGKRTQAENWLKNLTYDQMLALGIVNPASDAPNYADAYKAYTYYTKLINEKQAKEELDDAENDYENAVQDRKDAQRAYNIAKANKDAAVAALGVLGSDVEDDTVVGRYNKAAREYKDQMEALYGQTSESANYGVNGKEADGYYDTDEYDNTDPEHPSGSLYGSLKLREAEEAAAQAAKDTAQSLFDDALAASNVAAENVKAAAEHVAQTRAARDNAWTAYETAYNQATGELKININLADVVTEGGVADKWQLLPESLEDVYKNAPGKKDDGTGNLVDDPDVNVITKETDGKKDTASFYYTSILGGGETSAKLIDSVELDPSVTKEMFKYFDFDLNITLNSAQVNIDENGNYTAETAQSELGKYAILSTPANADSTITWSDTSTIPESEKAKVYRGTFNNGEETPVDLGAQNITELAAPAIFDYESYDYVVDIEGHGRYYGKNTTADTPFYKYDAATGTLLKEDTATVKDNAIKLTATAAEVEHTKKVTFKNRTDTSVADVVKDYVYAGSWIGETPSGASQYSTDGETWVTTFNVLTGDDNDQVVYYKTT